MNGQINSVAQNMSQDIGDTDKTKIIIYLNWLGPAWLDSHSLSYYNTHSNKAILNMHRKKWCLGIYHRTNTIASNVVVITGKCITFNFNVKFMSLS